jgi:hypothetical protein
MFRWKKQIFTEAEMVEQAVSADAVKEKDLIDLETTPESTETTTQPLDDKSKPDEERKLDDETKQDAAIRPDDEIRSDDGDKPDDQSGPDGGDLSQAEITRQTEEVADPVPSKHETETETSGYDVDQTEHHPETYAEAVKEGLDEDTIQEEVEPDSSVTRGTRDQATETPGYDVDETEHHAETYAEAVKEGLQEDTIQEEVEPDSPVAPGTQDGSTEISNQEEEKSATLLDKGKGKAGSPPTVDSPSTPAKSSVQTDEARDQVPSPRRPAATPTRDRPVSFPAMPRSVSHNSGLMSPQSGTSTPSRSPSHANLSESISNTSSGPGQETPDGKGGKTRKRLTSLKKMVRRISDQGTGLVRSNSTGRGGGLASPSPDAGDGKKRLPLQRGNSTGPGPQ